MDEILKEVHLDHLAKRFKDERIEPEHIISLSDEQLNRMGVTTIGDKIRLRDACKRLARAQPSTVATVAQSVLAERMSLFNPRGEKREKFGGAKKTKSTSKAKRSWTAQFVCLSHQFDRKVPTSKEKQQLQQAGLGLKKVKLDLDDKETDVISKITSDVKDEDGVTLGFPQLKGCGGFEMLYCASNTKELEPMLCSWDVKDLKANVGPQSKIFLRPIQQNLSTKPLLGPSKSQIRETCLSCGEEFLMRELRFHLMICKKYQYPSPCDGSSDEDDGYVDDNNKASTKTCSYTDNVFHGTENSSTSTSVFQVPDNNNTAGNTEASDQIISTHEVIEIADHGNTADEDETVQVPDQGSTEGGKSTVPLNAEMSVDEIVHSVIEYCQENQVANPVEVLRCLQKKMVLGRPLEIETLGECVDGETNYITVNRDKILQTAFDEIEDINNYRLTLEVQFSGEITKDYGGPRKEFFRLVLAAIKEKYFDLGIREHLSEDYYLVGVIMGMSMIQNGKLPQFIDEGILSTVFEQSATTDVSDAILQLRRGLKELGVYQICQEMPLVVHLFRPSPASKLTIKKLRTLLKPVYSEAGTNRLHFEKDVYDCFCKYIREVESGRRGELTLEHILKFTTGSEEEPILGFSLQPSLTFGEVQNSFLPTANTCSNTLILPHANTVCSLPDRDMLFELYDYAFYNTFFGNG